MKIDSASISKHSDRLLSDSAPFHSVYSDCPRLSTFRTDRSRHFLQNIFANHSEVAQSKQCMQSRSALGQATVSKLRAFASFDFLRCINQRPRGPFQIQRSALSGHHRNVPVHAKLLCLFAPSYTAIARICKYIGFLTVQDVLSLGDVTRIGGCRHQVVRQSGFCVDSDVGPYSKVVLDFLLFGLGHLKINVASIAVPPLSVAKLKSKPTNQR